MTITLSPQTQELLEARMEDGDYRRSRRGKLAVRPMPVSSFVIYYSVIESPPTVRILAIRRGARLPPRAFE